MEGSEGPMSKRQRTECPTFDKVGMNAAVAFLRKYDEDGDLKMLSSICSGEGGRRKKRGGNMQAILTWASGAIPRTREGFSNYISGVIYLVLARIVYDVSQSSPFAATIGAGFELWNSGQCASFSSLILGQIGFNPFCDAANALTQVVVKALVGNPLAISTLIGIATTSTLTPYLVHKIVRIISKSIVTSVVERTALIQDATTVEEARMAAQVMQEATPAERRQAATPLIDTAVRQGELNDQEAAEILGALGGASPRGPASSGGRRRKTRRGVRKTGRKSRKTRSKRRTRRH